MNEMYTKTGMCLPIPPDSFVFWGTLVEHLVVSTLRRTCMLWCMKDHDVCFGSSLLDGETWNDSFGSTVSGQWRVTQNGTLTLLRFAEESFFPTTHIVPGWLSRKLSDGLVATSVSVFENLNKQQ